MLDENGLQVSVRVGEFRIAVIQINDPEDDAQNEQGKRLQLIQEFHQRSPGKSSQNKRTSRIVAENSASIGRPAPRENQLQSYAKRNGWGKHFSGPCRR